MEFYPPKPWRRRSFDYIFYWDLWDLGDRPSVAQVTTSPQNPTQFHTLTTQTKISTGAKAMLQK
jgi:hypothetical protein